METITHPTIIFAAATAAMTMFMLHQRQKVKIIVETKKKDNVKRQKKISLSNTMPSFSTHAIHAGQPPDSSTGGVCVPINLSTTFSQNNIGVPTGANHPAGYNKGFDYARGTNPTRNAFEICIAQLEKGAKYCAAYGSGMAALTTVVHLCKHGDHIICCDDSYGGTQRLLRTIAGPIYNISSSYIDFNEPGALEKELKQYPNTTLIMFETPSNPTLKIIDFEKVVKVAKKYNVLTSCDNTFASLNGSQPLTFGVDIVVHAITKYINGHSDVVGGVVLTSNIELYKKFKHLQNSMGACLSPFDSYMAMRGVKTLSIRMERCEQNAMEIATYLENHTKVEKVLYPGLRSHPQHELACRQMSSFGGMISFFVKGDLNDCRTLLSNLKLFTLAESLGAVESLIESPALMTHHSVPLERLKEAGVEPNLVRVSVGIENVKDLINDFEQAFSFVGR